MLLVVFEFANGKKFNFIKSGDNIDRSQNLLHKLGDIVNNGLFNLLIARTNTSTLQLKFDETLTKPLHCAV